MGLSFWGVLNFLCFNGVAALATVSHVRGAHIFWGFWRQWHSGRFPCTSPHTHLLIFLPTKSTPTPAMMTDPGAVPREATPLPEEDEAVGGGLEEGKGADGQGGGDGKRRVRKYCRRCNAFKPPRAHHCSICRRCIIKMVGGENAIERCRDRSVVPGVCSTCLKLWTNPTNANATGTGPPLPLGEQLCGHREPQALPPLRPLHLSHVHLRAAAGGGALRGLPARRGRRRRRGPLRGRWVAVDG